MHGQVRRIDLPSRGTGTLADVVLAAMSALSGVVIGSILVLLVGRGAMSVVPVLNAGITAVVAGPIVAFVGAHVLVRAAAASARFRGPSSLDDLWFASLLVIGVAVGLVLSLSVR
jgi:hypothetical protein